MVNLKNKENWFYTVILKYFSPLWVTHDYINKLESGFIMGTLSTGWYKFTLDGGGKWMMVNLIYKARLSFPTSSIPKPRLNSHLSWPSWTFRWCGQIHQPLICWAIIYSCNRTAEWLQISFMNEWMSWHLMYTEVSHHCETPCTALVFSQLFFTHSNHDTYLGTSYYTPYFCCNYFKYTFLVFICSNKLLSVTKPSQWEKCGFFLLFFQPFIEMIAKVWVHCIRPHTSDWSC